MKSVKNVLKNFPKKFFFLKLFPESISTWTKKTHQSKPRHQLYYFKLKNNHTKHWLIFWEDISSSTTTPNNAKIRPSQTTFFSRKTFSKCNSSTYFLTSLVPLFHFFWSGCFINLARKSIQGQWNIILQKNSTFQKFKKKKNFFSQGKTQPNLKSVKNVLKNFPKKFFFLKLFPESISTWTKKHTNRSPDTSSTTLS